MVEAGFVEKGTGLFATEGNSGFSGFSAVANPKMRGRGGAGMSPKRDQVGAARLCVQVHSASAGFPTLTGPRCSLATGGVLQPQACCSGHLCLTPSGHLKLNKPPRATLWPPVPPPPSLHSSHSGHSVAAVPMLQLPAPHHSHPHALCPMLQPAAPPLLSVLGLQPAQSHCPSASAPRPPPHSLLCQSLGLVFALLPSLLSCLPPFLYPSSVLLQ